MASLSQDISFGLSILIPSWNNLSYLKMLIESIRLHSSIKTHQIIVHINEGTDGTLEWVKEQPNIEFTFSKENIGICKAMNQAFLLVKRPLTIYMNDDMYALPDWDKELMVFAEEYALESDKTWLSGTMVEPTGNNICCLAPRNYGTDLESFNEVGIIKDTFILKEQTRNSQGATWPPCILSKNLWEKVGGYSEEFSPGFGSDPDLAKKIYDIGVRNFIQCGRSLVYHFVCKTTQVKNFQHNDGEQTFLEKYGMSINNFVHLTLRRGSLWPKT